MHITMPDRVPLQKAAASDTPWPWVAGRLARGDTVALEPCWDGLRAVLAKAEGGWTLQVGDTDPVAWPFDALPDAPDVVLDGVLLAKQGALWLAPDGIEAMLRGEQQAHPLFMAVDCLAYAGENLRGRAGAVRRVYAEKAVVADVVTLTPAYAVTGKQTLAVGVAKARELAPSRGAVLKCRRAPYTDGPSDTWLALATPHETVPDVGPLKTGMRLLKAEATQQKVVGIVFEPEVEDTQGDVTPAVDIEAACHQFLSDYRAGHTELWLNHTTRLTDQDAVLVENYIAPAAMTIGSQAVKAGTWLQVWHVKSAQLWQDVLDGRFTGFSFGGTGVRGPLRKAALPAVRFERDADGLASHLITPTGRFAVLRDVHKRVVGLEDAA